jgi:hypothetical protein
MLCEQQRLTHCTVEEARRLPRVAPALGVARRAMIDVILGYDPGDGIASTNNVALRPPGRARWRPLSVARTMLQ